MNKLLDHIRYLVKLSAQGEQAVLSAFKQKFYPKGHILLYEGEVSGKLYFILKGTPGYALV